MAKSETRRNDKTLVWKSETETVYEENRDHDFVLRKSQPVLKTAARNELHDILR